MWHDALGVTVKLRPVSATTLSREINATVNNPRGLQMWAASWQEAYADPQQWTSLPFGKESPLNAVNYGQNHSSDFTEQQQTQQALAAADIMPLSPDRFEQYVTANQQLINDVAWIPMFQSEAVYQVQPYIYRYASSYSEGMMQPIQWSYVYVGQH